MAQNIISKTIIDNNEYQIVRVTSGGLKQNGYILKHKASGDILLIDPGGDFGTTRGQIERMDGTTQMVLLTHAHFDHVGGVKDAVEHYQIPLYLHAGDKKLLRYAPLYAIRFEQKVISVPTDFIPVVGALIEWAGQPIEVIETPGHTDGSVCYLIGTMCFTGDTILRNAIGNTNLPGSNLERLHASVDNLFELLLSEVLLFPGHDDPWSVCDANKWWVEKQKKMRGKNILESSV